MTQLSSAALQVCPPPGGRVLERVSALGVDYQLSRAADGGDLYLTSFGAAFREQLAPENWLEPRWYAARRQRLCGTSAVFRVPTKPVRGISLDLVVRYNRVGETVPVDTQTMCEYPHAEFNSPFEEFSQVMALRRARPDLCPSRIRVKKPMAIFSPDRRLQPWQTGRREHVFVQKQARHPELRLDILRQYILLYGYIEGLNAVQAVAALGLAGAAGGRFLADMMRRAIKDLSLRGFRMIDIKPHHIIVHFRSDGSLLRDSSGQPAYALVDYELLERAGE